MPYLLKHYVIVFRDITVSPSAWLTWACHTWKFQQPIKGAGQLGFSPQLQQDIGHMSANLSRLIWTKNIVERPSMLPDVYKICFITSITHPAIGAINDGTAAWHGRTSLFFWILSCWNRQMVRRFSSLTEQLAGTIHASTPWSWVGDWRSPDPSDRTGTNDRFIAIAMSPAFSIVTYIEPDICLEHPRTLLQNSSKKSSRRTENFTLRTSQASDSGWNDDPQWYHHSVYNHGIGGDFRTWNLPNRKLHRFPRLECEHVSW